MFVECTDEYSFVKIRETDSMNLVSLNWKGSPVEVSLIIHTNIGGHSRPFTSLYGCPGLVHLDSGVVLETSEWGSIFKLNNEVLSTDRLWFEKASHKLKGHGFKGRRGE